MSSHEGGCCKSSINPLHSQNLEEIEFERGIWNAALNGETERVRMMLDKGVDPNKPDRFGYTALHYAARNGKIEVCHLLIKRRANVNARTHGGAHPLHRAAHQGHTEIVELLLANGANPFLLDSDMKNALHKAAEQGHLDVAKVLVENYHLLKYEHDKNGHVPQYYVPPDKEELRDFLSVEDMDELQFNL